MKIKYRVWHNKFERFLTTDDEWYLDMNGKLHSIHRGYMEVVNTNFYEVDSFTGFLDKNGKEIYDHDFIKYSTSTYKDSIAMVTWYSMFGCWGLFTKMSVNLCNSFNLEIVGNSHQNSELFNTHLK